MNMNDAGAVFLRHTSENHHDTPPPCDEACWLRWYDQPHLHLCPDGLDAPGPLMTITNWCSCGAKLSGPEDYDARDAGMEAAVADQAARTLATFKAHALEVHKVDIETDLEWQRRLTGGFDAIGN